MREELGEVGHATNGRGFFVFAGFDFFKLVLNAQT